MHSSAPEVCNGDVTQDSTTRRQNAPSHNCAETPLELADSAAAGAETSSVATVSRHCVGGLEIVIAQRPEMGIGWMLWDAAQHLVDHIASNPASVAHRGVMELGSGCGLCGMAAAALGARSVTLTDSASVMPCLQDSIDRNRESLGACDISCQVLDWTADDALDFSNRLQKKQPTIRAANDACSPQRDAVQHADELGEIDNSQTLLSMDISSLCS